MSFKKISSSQVPTGSAPIQAGHRIYWHYAMFEGLMTVESKMLSSSFLTGIESGYVGLGPNKGSRWLLYEALSVQCFLGEKSIWIFR
jgi:hypothetical protein